MAIINASSSGVEHYLFYFPGMGNTGDNHDPEEQALLHRLDQHTGGRIHITTLYPYGPGLTKKRENSIGVLLSAAFGGARQTIAAKASQVWNAALEGIPVKDTVGLLNNRQYDTRTTRQGKVRIHLFGYSAGGQIAYRVAQKLAEQYPVENLILFGAPWRAYRGVQQIGRVWEVWTAGDLNGFYRPAGRNYGGMAYNLLGWRGANRRWQVAQQPNASRLVFGGKFTSTHTGYFSQQERLETGQPIGDAMVELLAKIILGENSAEPCA